MSYAEKNVQASLDYAQSLLHAKDLTEVMRLHGDYVQAQMRSLAEQASELGQIFGRAAMDAAKPTKTLEQDPEKLIRTGAEQGLILAAKGGFVPVWPGQRLAAGEIRPVRGHRCGIAH